MHGGEGHRDEVKNEFLSLFFLSSSLAFSLSLSCFVCLPLSFYISSIVSKLSLEETHKERADKNCFEKKLEKKTLFFRLVASSKNSASDNKGLRALVDVHYRNPDGSPGCIEGAALVMFGTGRRPNSRGLGLEEAGVDIDERSGAIKVDSFSRTTAPGVWAIGDVTDRMALTPVALMEAMAFCESAFGE